MSQYGEGTATQNIYVETPEDKEEISVRLSLFYDGTLNNRVNIEEREAVQLQQIGPSGEVGIFSPYNRHKGDGDTSYDNGRTNIAIMEPHLRKKSEGYEIALKAYIEGQGTFNLKGDNRKGYALGGGDSGVASRAEQGIERGLDKIAGQIDPNDFCIKKLTIDVFGFSRGAATARYAIHLLLKGSTKWENEDGDGYAQDVSPILELIANRGIEIQEKAVEICFAGLYDTVLSYYGSQKLPFKWVGNLLQQTAVRHAKKTLHLAAADEHRADFPLHNIRSAGSKGEEYFLPGVHSDVGGSYNTASELALEAETDPNKKVFMKTTSENKIILKSSKQKKLENDMNTLVEQGWYYDDNKEIKIIEHKIQKKRLNGKITTNAYFYELEVDREGICSAYCNIPLKIMAKYARDSEVKLKLNNKLDRRAEIILKPHDDLQALEKKITAYISNKKGNGLSKAEDWIGDNQPLNKFLIDRKIRHDHFNFSSHPGWGYTPRIKNGKRRRYVYKA